MKIGLKGILIAGVLTASVLSGCTFAASAPKDTATLYDGTSYKFSLVSCADASAEYNDAVDGLCGKITELTGNENFVSYNDKQDTPSKAPKNEITVGEVDRLYARIALQDIEYDYTYVVEVTENSIVIAGSTEKYVLMGIEYFTDIYLKENTLVDGNAVYIKTGRYVNPSAIPSFGEYVHFKTRKEETPKCSVESEFTFAPSDLVKSTHVLQGSCLSGDGKYMFIALHEGGEGTKSVLAKYEISTGKTVTTNLTPDCDHANDITYIPEDDMIAVVHNAPRTDTVSYYKASDLKFVKKVTAAVKLHSLSYCAERGQYIGGISSSKDDFAILDKNLKQVKKFSFASAGGTHQGGDCDKDYIYFVQSGVSKGNSTLNTIVTYDWNGNRIATTFIPDITMEIEGMTHAGNEYYVSFYRGYSLKGGAFYKFSYNY